MADHPGHFREVLTPVSRVRYLMWRLVGGQREICLDLKSALRLYIRSLSTTDYGVAWDIYLRGCYECPEALQDVRRVVDLGANVGYSCLFWCRQYPECHVKAFEPHPLHLKAIQRQLSENDLLGRVEVLPVAVGTRNQRMYLEDAGSSSTVTDRQSLYQVQVADLFQILTGAIDILKIDIEGGEYELLDDPRFHELNVRVLVVEWHKTPDRSDGRMWCIERLHNLGYRTQIGLETLPAAGLIWGFREVSR